MQLEIEMKKYLDELFANFNKISHYSEENEKRYDQKIKDFIIWDKPDFVALIGPESLEVFPYQKNLRLDFNGRDESVYEAVLHIIEEQQKLITKIDLRTMQYLFEISSTPMDILFKLRFNIEFVKGDVRTLVRKVHIVEVNKYGKPKVGLMGVTDMTDVMKGERVVFEAKTTKESILNSKEYKSFMSDINNIINGSVFLTNREREVLHQITEGKTSFQISQNLSIAKTTVDKHRQNMLKKYNVSNITSLLRLLN